MATFVVKAYEGTYGGLHGMSTVFVTEGTKEETQMEADQASLDVMDSYDLVDGLMEGNEDCDEEDVKQENIAWEIYEVKPECPITFEGINKIINVDFEEFVKDWCIDDSCMEEVPDTL